MCNCNVIPCPECGNAIEHDPDLGAPEPCSACQAAPTRRPDRRSSRRVAAHSPISRLPVVLEVLPLFG